MIRILGLALYGPLAASTRYRLGQYVAGLSKHGIELDLEYLLSDEYIRARYENQKLPLADMALSVYRRITQSLNRKRYDLAIVYGELIPFAPHLFERYCLRMPYIYDMDDAFYLKYQHGWKKIFSPLLKGKFEEFTEKATVVTAGSRFLESYAKQWNRNVRLLPTVVDTERYIPLTRSTNRVFTVGWIGSPTTSAYLDQLVEPLERISSFQAIRMVVIGGKPIHLKGVEVVSLPWKEEEEVKMLNSFDVGVMPLPNNEWAKGKCAFKLIQCMAVGTPVVASGIGANIDVVTPDCGYLANSPEDWIAALCRLCKDETLRNKMGRSARDRVIRDFSLNSNLPQLIQIIKETV